MSPKKPLWLPLQTRNEEQDSLEIFQFFSATLTKDIAKKNEIDLQRPLQQSLSFDVQRSSHERSKHGEVLGLKTNFVPRTLHVAVECAHTHQ